MTPTPDFSPEAVRKRILAKQDASDITPEKALARFAALIESSKCPGCGEYVGHPVSCPFRARPVDAN